MWDPLGAGVAGGYELIGVGAGNELWASNQ